MFLCVLGQKAFPEDLPSFLCGRTDILEFAKEAKVLGIQYIGLCCGNASHYIRTVAEVYGRTPHASKYSPDMSEHYIFGKISKPYHTNKLLPDMSS